jgi:predicted dehydrogenase
MLAEARPQIVFIVTGYDADARPTYPPLAIDAMRAGAHAWIEKPPAATVEEVQQMLDAERRTGKFTQVGYKKMFFPAIAKAKEIGTEAAAKKMKAVWIATKQYRTRAAPVLRDQLFMEMLQAGDTLKGK